MGFAQQRKWWALAALALVSMVIGLDMMVLNVALPTLAKDLNASTSDLQWFANAYSLVLAAALLPAGMLGDRYGRKKFLIGALVLFGIASLACAYCTDVTQLIGARVLLGIGAAFLMPLSMSILTVLFSDGERSRALTMIVTANSIGLPLGPIVGGLLLDHFWWGSVFLINVPVVAVAVIAAVTLLPESRSSSQPRLDVFGVALSSMGLVGLTYGVIRIGDDGWSSGTALAWMAAGAATLAGFVAWQLRLHRRPNGQPLVDIGLFSSRRFTWGTILATLATFAMFGVFFVMPQFFQAVDGTDALGTGLRLLPVIGGLLVGARAADKLVRKTGTGLMIASGYGVFAAGLLLGSFTSVGSGYGYVATWFALVGVGIGLALPAAMDAALGALSKERSGVGSALIQAVRQVGGAIGVAILGTVLNSTYRDSVDVTGLPAEAADTVKRGVTAGVAVATQLRSPELLAAVRRAFADAMDSMLLVSTGVALAGVVLALIFLPRRPEPAPVDDAAAALVAAESTPDLVV
jgi:EmrB/QacA subfamily drug resistance transporter